MMLLVLGICCAIPLVKSLLGGTEVSSLEVAGAVGGSIVAFYQVYKQVQSDRSSEALHATSGAIEQRVRDLGQELSDVQQQLVFLCLNEDTRQDSTEAGIAWRHIRSKMKSGPYDAYCREYPDSPYAKEAQQRREDLAAWDLVDKSDPIAIHLFLLGGPFDALRMVAEASVRKATDSARAEHRREFWRHVGIPFYILYPLFPLIYVVIIGAGMGVYQLAGHPKVTAYFVSAEQNARDAVALHRDTFLGSAAPTVSAAADQVAEGARLAVAVGSVIAVGGLLVFAVGRLRELVAPIVAEIEEDVDEGSATAFEAVA